MSKIFESSFTQGGLLLDLFNVVSLITPTIVIKFDKEKLLIRNISNSEQIIVELDIPRHSFREFFLPVERIPLLLKFKITQLKKFSKTMVGGEDCRIIVGDVENEEDVEILFKIGEDIVYRTYGKLANESNEKWVKVSTVDELHFRENFSLDLKKIRSKIVSIAKSFGSVDIGLEGDSFILTSDTGLEYIKLGLIPLSLDRKTTGDFMTSYDLKDLKRGFNKPLEAICNDIELFISDNSPLKIDIRKAEFDLLIFIYPYDPEKEEEKKKEEKEEKRKKKEGGKKDE